MANFIAINGTIAESGEQDIFTFDGTAGQRFYLDALDNDPTFENLTIRIISPTGTEIYSGGHTSNSAPFALLETGTYQILIDDATNSTAQIGDYSFQLLEVDAAPTLVLGSPVSGTLTPGLQSDLFQFTGFAGQRLQFDSLLASTGGTWQVYGPNNQAISGAFSNLNGDFTVVLPGNGTYLLVLEGSNASAAVPYNFQVNDLSDPPLSGPNTGFGTVQTGTITAGETDSYTFTASRGTRIWFDSQDGDFDAVNVELRDPSNNIVFSGNASLDLGTFLLNRSGTYTLNVLGSNATSTGDYSFQLLDLQGSSTAVTLGSTVTQTLTPGNASRVHRFTGAVGQRLFYDALDSDFDSVLVRLIGPSGQDVSGFGGNTDSDRGPITLTEAGTYYLLVDGDVATNTDYNFRLLEASAAPTLTLDSTITGSLTPGNETDIFRFTGTANQRLTLDNLTGGSGASWTLYGPNNQSIGSNSLNGDFDVTLPGSGEYVLVLTGNSPTAPVNYSFNVVTPTTTTTALVLGTTVTSAIAESGEQDIYTFNGTVGQRLYLDSLDNDFESLSFRLISPSGQLLLNRNHSSDSTPITLTEAGQYQLIIDDNSNFNGVTGDYSFRLLNASTAPLLTLDTTINGDLTPGSETDLFRINGIAGQRINFSSLSGGFGATWTLYGPGNQVIRSNSLNGDFESTLAADGQYLLVLASTSNTPINYSFTAVTPTTNTTILTLGSTITNSIAEAGEQDIYTFTGTSGQRLFLDSLDSVPEGLRIRLLGPSGQVFNLDTTSDSNNPVTLTEAGQYQVIVDDNSDFSDATGDYSFRLLDASAANSLTLDSTLNGSLTPGNETDIFRFTGAANQRITFNSLLGSNSATWQLYGPGNQSIGSSGLNGDFEVTLPSDGEYLLVLRGFNAAAPINYSFSAVNSTTTTNAYTLGSTISSTIGEPGEQDIYTFNGTIGQRLYFDTLDSDTVSESLFFRLISPTGVQVFSVNHVSGFVPFTLTESGQYQLIIDDNNNFNDATGDYSFRLSDIASAPVLTIGATANTGTLAPGLETDLFQFTGTAGQILQFDSLLGSNSDTWILYDPNNQVIRSSASLNTDFIVTLPGDGTYVLLLQGNNASANVPYSFQVSDLSDAAGGVNVGFGTVQTGTINAGETDSFTFTASRGTRIWFDSLLTAPASLNVLIRDRNDVVVLNGDITSDFGPTLLSRSGNYTVTITGANPTTTGNYSFQLLDLQGNSTALNLGDTVTQTLTPGNTTRIYRFTGTVGQRLFYDALDNNFDAVTARLISPTGQELLGGNSDSERAPFTLNETGTYYLLFDGDVPTNTNLNFRLLNASAATVLTLDSTVTGNLTPGLETDIFRFAGAANQRITFDNLSGGLGASWTLYGPNNQFISSTNLSDDFDVTLPGAGEYLLVLFGGNPAAPINYSFTAVTPTTTTNALTLGTTVTSTIAESGEQDIYTFNGTTGQRLFFDSLDNDFEALTVRLISPTGQVVTSFNHSGEINPFTLIETGQYQLIIDDNSQFVTTLGDYSFRLLNASTAPAIALDTTITGDLTPGNETDIFRFTGTANQRLAFNNLTGTGGNWILYGPNNQVVTSNGINADFDTTLPANGEYLLALQGNNTLAPINYSFSIITPTITTNAYTLGSTVNSTIAEQGERDIYTFNGGVGQRLFFDSLNSNVAGLNARLVSPSGQVVFNFTTASESSRPFTLFEAGQYQLIVDDGSDVGGSGSGDYSFRVLDAAAAPLLAFDTPTSGTLTPGNETDIFRINGTAGQRLVFDRTVGTTGAFWSLYGPSSQLFIANQFLSTDFEVILPANGEYLLVLEGRSPSTPINYDFTVVTPNAVTTPLGTDIQIGFTATAYSVNEDGTPVAIITLERTGSLNQAVAVTLTPSNGTAVGTATGVGGDFDNSPIVVNFGIGATTRTVTIPITNDTAIEGNETVQLTLSNPTNGASLSGQNTATLTIVDNDILTPGALAFSAATYSVNEDGTPVAAVTVTRTGGSDGPVSVTLTPSNGTATAPGDFTNTPITVNFIDGQTSQTVTIPIVSDNRFEPGNETINLTLSGATGGASLGTRTTAVLTVVDDDSQPTVTISPSTVTRNEGNSGTTSYTFTVNLSNQSNQTVTVPYTINDGTATAGSDYIDNDGTLTFNPGVTSQTITVEVNGDATVEPNETFTVNLGTPTNANLGTTTSSTATIVNDDAVVTNPGVIQFNRANYTVNEDGTPVVAITLTRTGGSDGAVSVTLTPSDDTAIAPNDYTATPIVVDFTDGQLQQTVTVPIVDDGDPETTEQLTLTLSAPTGGAILGTQTTANLNIRDNDIRYDVVTSNPSLVEGNTGVQTITFTVSRTGATTNASNVAYAIAGTASNGSDYNNIGGTSGATGLTGTIAFAAGELNKTITLDVLGDVSFEANETITVTLSNPTAPGTGSLDAGAATTTIQNDDTGINPITGTPGNDALIGTNGSDLIRGLGGNDRLRGLGGDDKLQGGTGNDRLSGDDGKDTLSGDSGDDTLLGSNGDDSLLGGSGNDSLVGGNGNDFLDGGSGNDRLFGFGENDAVVGGIGDDSLHGGGGNDILKGDAGRDILTGGSGSDRFQFDGVFTAIGLDTITDMGAGDRIQLSQATFGLGGVAGGTILSTQFARVTNNGAAATSSARIVYNTNTGQLFYNTNGVNAGFGSGGNFVTLSNSFNLQSTQIQLTA
jgi:Ca2+-binding RTX toxin-like protein